MFRALSEITGSTDPRSVNTSNFQNVQSYLYNKAFPNFTPVGSAQKQDFLISRGLAPLQVINPTTRQPTQRDLMLQNYPMTLEVPQNIINKNSECASASIDQLIGSQNLEDSIRCGWIYQNGPNGRPLVSQGALGTRDGPVTVVDQPKGKWYWSVDKAKEQIAADTCKRVTSKADMERFKETCEWDSVKGIAVPIGTATKVRGSRSRDLCDPLPNGSLSRDCILQRVSAAGCAQGGALALALTTGASPNDYGASLRNLPSFIEYQRKAASPIMDSIIRNGKTTAEIALLNFEELSDKAKPGNTSLNAAARDLCLRKGEFAEFDFCSEYTDRTPGPFILDCLQRAWKNMGGSPKGTDYPTSQNKSQWDALTWGQVQNRIDTYKNQLKSDDVDTQNAALMKFLGVKRTEVLPLQIQKIQGVEVFWFNTAQGYFMGRRIHIGENPSSSTIEPNFSTGGEVDKTGLADNIQFVTITNIRPPATTSVNLTFETDDGATIVVNRRDFVHRYGLKVTADTAFSANWHQAPTRHDNPVCWNLSATNPNYTITRWYEGGGWAHFKLFYKPCNTNQAVQKIPTSWFNLTQEPDAPMLSYEVQKSSGGGLVWSEFRLNHYTSSGISGTATVQENNTSGIKGLLANACINLGPRGAIVWSDNLGLNCWRTITIAFQLTSPPDTTMGRRLFDFGTMSIQIDRNSTLAFQTTSVSGRRVLTGNTLEQGRTYMLVITVKSSVMNEMPNILTVSCATVQDWESGRARIGDIPYSQVATTDGGRPVFNRTDFAKPIVGSISANGANANIYWVHFFDQEFTNEHCQREAKCNWARKFIPL